MTEAKRADLGSVVERIGEAIQRRRERVGLDIAQLAREAHVSRTTIYDLEEGRTANPRDSSVGKIMRALEEAEAESGVTQVVPSETPEELRTFQFQVEGDFGVKVTASGPVEDHEILRADVIEIIRSIREGGGKSTT